MSDFDTVIVPLFLFSLFRLPDRKIDPRQPGRRFGRSPLFLFAFLHLWKRDSRSNVRSLHRSQSLLEAALRRPVVFPKIGQEVQGLLRSIDFFLLLQRFQHFQVKSYRDRFVLFFCHVTTNIGESLFLLPPNRLQRIRRLLLPLAQHEEGLYDTNIRQRRQAMHQEIVVLGHVFDRYLQKKVELPRQMIALHHLFTE
jgi:hypothetical protein